MEVHLDTQFPLLLHWAINSNQEIHVCNANRPLIQIYHFCLRFFWFVACKFSRLIHFDQLISLIFRKFVCKMSLIYIMIYSPRFQMFKMFKMPQSEFGLLLSLFLFFDCVQSNVDDDKRKFHGLFNKYRWMLSMRCDFVITIFPN